MICEVCRGAADIDAESLVELDFANKAHELCRGKTWCDCQHRPIGTGIKRIKYNAQRSIE